MYPSSHLGALDDWPGLTLHGRGRHVVRADIDATLAALASMRVNQQKAQSDEVALLSM